MILSVSETRKSDRLDTKCIAHVRAQSAEEDEMAVFRKNILSVPNDPVFYLNHCNVDRIWEGWMQKHRAWTQLYAKDVIDDTIALPRHLQVPLMSSEGSTPKASASFRTVLGCAPCLPSSILQMVL